MNESKIDSVVNSLVDEIRHKNRGFVLDLAAGTRERVEAARGFLAVSDADTAPQEIIDQLEQLDAALARTAIEVRESLPPVDEYEPPADWRSHEISDTESFIAYVRRYGRSGKSLVMVNEDAATVALDETAQRGEREVITAPFKVSEDWEAWSGSLGQEVQHRALLRFLVRQEHNLDDAALLQVLRTLKMNSTVDLDSDVQDSGEQIGVVFKSSGGEEVKKFKRLIPITLPVLEQDTLETPSWVEAKVKLNIQMPGKPGEPPMFALSCSNWRNIRLGRIRAEMLRVREELGDDWTVLLGRHQTRCRKVGRGDGA